MVRSLFPTIPTSNPAFERRRDDQQGIRYLTVTSSGDGVGEFAGV
jgi:hypothetical protein